MEKAAPDRHNAIKADLDKRERMLFHDGELDEVVLDKPIITELADIIRKRITAETWGEHGGSVGTIFLFGHKLLIFQTPESHEQIVNLLEQLGTAQ